MADNTNRFGLNTYSQGDTNWDHTDTVQTIDELAIERGAAADRPDSGDYDDELYLATDQQILYRWDDNVADWIVEGVGSETDPLPKVWANEIDVEALEAEQANTRSGYVDKSADRSFGTWYQNTTGSDLDVSVVIGSDTDGSDIQGFLEVNETQEGESVSRVRDIFDANFRFTLSATVAEGEYYRVRVTGDDQNATKDEWKEQQ